MPGDGRKDEEDEAVGIDDYGLVARPLQRMAAFYGGTLNEPFSLDGDDRTTSIPPA